MASLPSLTHWEQSSHSLHKAAQILGAIRQLVRERVPNYLELALRIERNVLSTDVLPSGGTVLLDFIRVALVYTSKSGETAVISLTEHSQVSLLETLLIAMDAHGESLAKPDAGQSYVQAFLVALDAHNHPFKPRPSDLTSDALLMVDPQTSTGYAVALYGVFTAAARFRARLVGPQTPIVVWPEHFDLSTLWFPTNDRSDEAPSMNFGFAPFDGNTERPYLYAYAYPMPENFVHLPLPKPARWHTEGWKGMFVAYDDLMKADDPEPLIEALFERVYGLLAPTLNR